MKPCEPVSCAVVQDLLPLVIDGVASKESEALVSAHLHGCERCRAADARMRSDIAQGRSAEAPAMRDVMRGLWRRLSVRLALLMLALFLLYALILHPALYGAHYDVPYGSVVPESAAVTTRYGVPILSLGLREPVYSQLGGTYWFTPDASRENGVALHMRWSISWASHLRSLLHLRNDVEMPYTGEVYLSTLAREAAGAYGDDAVLTAIWYDEGDMGSDDLSRAHLIWEAGEDELPMMRLGLLRLYGGKE